MFRVICHLDMDAFYASVEQRDNPALIGRPVIVGAPPTQRGMVCAANKLLAKIASDHQKPDGLTIISEQEKVQFLRPLPVRAIYGVGKVTEQVLVKAGLETVGDLQDYPGDLRALVVRWG